MRKRNPKRAKTLFLGRPEIALKKSGRWWAASLPAMPGAYGQGRTKAEAIDDLWDAVQELAKAHQQLERERHRASARVA